MDDYQKQIEVVHALLSEVTNNEVVEVELDGEHQGTETVSFRVRYVGQTEFSPDAVEVPWDVMRDRIMEAKAARAQERPVPPVPEQFTRSVTVLATEEAEKNARLVTEALSDIDLSKDDAPESAQARIDELKIGLKVIYGPPVNTQGVTCVTQFGVVALDPLDTTAGCSFQFGALAGSYERAIELLQQAVRGAKV